MPKAKRKTYSPTEIQKVLDRFQKHSDTLTLKDFSELVQIPASTIGGWIKKYGSEPVPQVTAPQGVASPLFEDTAVATQSPAFTPSGDGAPSPLWAPSPDLLCLMVAQMSAQHPTSPTAEEVRLFLEDARLITRVVGQSFAAKPVLA